MKRPESRYNVRLTTRVRTSTLKVKSRPPSVGVPVLVRCVLGPSTRTCLPRPPDAGTRRRDTRAQVSGRTPRRPRTVQSASGRTITADPGRTEAHRASKAARVRHNSHVQRCPFSLFAPRTCRRYRSLAYTKSRSSNDFRPRGPAVERAAADGRTDRAVQDLPIGAKPKRSHRSGEASWPPIGSEIDDGR
jgi:hypothetical protein